MDEKHLKLPLEKRCVHERWQVRKNGYEELIKLFQQLDNDKEFAKYLGLIRNFVMDNNPISQEKGLEATLMFIKRYNYAGRTVEEVMPQIVTKALAAPKTSTKKLAEEVILMYIEINEEDKVQEALLKGMEQKNLKIVAACISASTVALREFGSKVVKVKPLVQIIPNLFANKDKGVKDEAKLLAVEIYRWIGAALRPYLTDLEPHLLNELNTEFSNLDGHKAQPRCYINTVQQNESAVFEEIDTATTIDVSSQFTDSLLNTLNSRDATVRIKTLNEIHKIIQSATFIEPDLGNLPQALSRSMTDNNKIVAQSAINICEQIAKAMGPPSELYITVFFPLFVKNLGDSKLQLRAAAKKAIEAFADQCGYEHFFQNEMIVNGLKTGRPQSQIELWNWLAKFLPEIPAELIPKEELVICIPILLSHIRSRNSEIKASSQKAVLGIMTHVGYDTMVAYAKKLKPGIHADDVRKILDNEKTKLPHGQPVNVRKIMTISKNIILKPKDSEISSGTYGYLKFNDLKHQRIVDERELKTPKWSFTKPTKELVDLLREQINVAGVSDSIARNMFHEDSRRRLNALEELTKDLYSNSAGLIANLDLILKWLSLRCYDTKSFVIFKSFTYLQCVLNVLTEKNYQLLENEADAFIPHLVIKIADDEFCDNIHSLLKQICHVYPIHLLVNDYVMKGVRSDVVRQKKECLDVLASLIREYDLSICRPAPFRIVRELEKLTYYDDKSIHLGAISCLLEIYKLLNVFDSFANVVAQLQEDVNILKGIPLPTPPPPLPPTPQESSQETVVEPSKPTNSFFDTLSLPDLLKEVRQIDLEFLKEEVMIPASVPECLRPKTLSLDLSKPTDSNITVLSEEEGLNPLSWFIDNMLSDRRLTAIRAFRNFRLILGIKSRDDMREIEDRFIGAAIKQLHVLENEGVESNASHRVILKTLNTFYSNHLGRHVSLENLKRLVEYLNHFFTRLTVIEDSSEPIKLCELVWSEQRVIKLCYSIVKYSDPTNVTCLLVRLIHEYTRNQKFKAHSELLTKCVRFAATQIELNKMGEILDYDEILLEVHNFIKEFSIKIPCRRNQPMDSPLKSVMRLVDACVYRKREHILLHLDRIPNFFESELLPEILSVLQERSPKDHRPTLPPRVAFYQQVYNIFCIIGAKGRFLEGMELLYNIMQEHPETNIRAYLKRIPPLWRYTITEHLSKLKEKKRSAAIEAMLPPAITAEDKEEMSHPEFWKNRLEIWTKLVRELN